MKWTKKRISSRLIRLPMKSWKAEYKEAVALNDHSKATPGRLTKRDSSLENLSRRKIARPGLASSNRDFRVCGADSCGNWKDDHECPAG